LFPKSSKGVIFGLIVTSGLLSSILSNTTTALLLIPIALFITKEDKIKMRFALAVAYGASIGGVLTPIGTPPNLILFGLMQEMGLEKIPFAQWVWMVAPLVIIMFAVVSFVLGIGLKNEPVHSKLQEAPLNVPQKKVLGVLFSLVVILFFNAPIEPYYSGLGLSDTGILLSAGLILFAPPFTNFKLGGG